MSKNSHRTFVPHLPPPAPPPPSKKSLLWSRRSPHQRRKASLARGESEREKLTIRPRGAPGPQDHPGAPAAAAARSRPAWPLGAARARGGRGHGHARRASGGGRRRVAARPCARRARLRPLGKGGGRWARLARSPFGLLLPPIRAPVSPRPGAAQPRPRSSLPARLSGRGTSSAPRHGKR